MKTAPMPCGAASVSGSAGHARDPFTKPVSQAFRRPQYLVLILLCAVAALTLNEIVGASLQGAATPTTSWLRVAIGSYLEWLITLVPAAILIAFVGEVRAQRGVTRVFWLSIGLMFACITGTILKDSLLYGANIAWIMAHFRDVLADTCALTFPVALLVIIYELHLSSSEAVEAALRVQSGRIKKEAEVSRGRLRLLRAQIEPHFIFNSLAHVRRLYQIDPAKGHQMLASLIRYFGSAFPSLRQETCSLEQEAALIGAYLDIHCLRMGTRLVYEVAFPSNLCGLQIPTLMLLTLVENAIKHGLSPMPDGGFVRVSAVQTDTVLELRVADSGRGLTACSGRGTGLANIRARLNALYGSAAVLRLSTNQPCGITAVVRLPMSRVAA